MLLLCSVCSYALATSYPPLVRVMERWVGTVEITNNDGPLIRTMLESVGLHEGDPYCAAAVSLGLDSARAAWPTVRTGLAMAFRVPGYWTLKDVLAGRHDLKSGDIGIMQRGTTWRGHAYVVRDVYDGNVIRTIEGNTTPGPEITLDARKGGVWEKTHYLKKELYNYFGTRFFIRPRYT